MDEVPGGCKLPTEREQQGINVKFLVTLEMQAQTAPHHHPPPQREIWKPEGEKWSCISPVWPCWVLGVGDMLCCAVMFPEEGLDLLTACLQTVEGRYLLKKFHHSPLNSFYSLSISSFGETTPRQDRLLVLLSCNAHQRVGWWFGRRFHPLK